MLSELAVENYAVVERLRIRFHRGLNLLTGETGSGKSIVVDALGLLYGGRASADSVRSGTERARISGIFEVPNSPEFRELLDRHGIEPEDGELLIEREIQAGGKSRAFVSSRPVTTAVLREMSPFLGDIHGQHDQQELFSSDSQLDLLDAFAHDADLRQQTAAQFAAWTEAARQLSELDHNEQEKLRLADLWSFQRREIEEAALTAGEDERLEAERRVLLNVSRLNEHASAAYEALYDSESSAVILVRQARKRIEELCRIDPSLEETLETLKPAEIALSETSHSLSSYLGGLEADPARLEQVETRLATLDKLKRKYGPTLDDILTFLADVQAKLDSVETAAERRAALEKERDTRATQYEAAAHKLSAARQSAAQTLEKSVESELTSLAMAGTIFRIEFTTGAWTPRGTDRIRFLVSANVGEEPKPMDKIASGGELSRLALALKTCTTQPAKPARPTRNSPSSTPRTLVFDEVDAGIGGRTAESVAKRLKRLAASEQVLCVTHLPQVAAYADHHYVVEKKESNGRTIATITHLDGDTRTRELARMLSGTHLTPEALKHAEQLIKLGSRPD